MPRFLHVGCGPKRKHQTIAAFAGADWGKVTLDLDENVEPHIAGKLPELVQVPYGSFEAVHSPHSLTHPCPHEVPVVLRDCHRALKSDGIAIIRCRTSRPSEKS